MGDVTNADRADWAEIALAAFVEETRMHHEDAYTQIKDLLADLHHLADRLNLDWDAMLAGAEMHHDAEVEEEEGP